jgi:hypothetical protein
VELPLFLLKVSKQEWYLQALEEGFPQQVVLQWLFYHH